MQTTVASARLGEDPLRLAHSVRHLGDAYYYAGRAPKVGAGKETQALWQEAATQDPETLQYIRDVATQLET